SKVWAATKSPLPGILSPSPPTRRKYRSSASTQAICSGSGIGSEGGTPWTPPSASRPCSPSVRILSAPCWKAFTRWTNTSARLTPCDFIAFGHPLNPLGQHQDILLANVFAQAEALAFGKTADQVKAEGTPDWLMPHRVFEGNRPSNTILIERLTPETLGNLV